MLPIKLLVIVTGNISVIVVVGYKIAQFLAQRFQLLVTILLVTRKSS